jgi:hypothetical protein
MPNTNAKATFPKISRTLDEPERAKACRAIVDAKATTVLMSKY